MTYVWLAKWKDTPAVLGFEKMKPLGFWMSKSLLDQDSSSKCIRPKFQILKPETCHSLLSKIITKQNNSIF